MSFRASARFISQDKNELILELPLSTSILDAIQQAKQLSNEYLTNALENTLEPEPIKHKKIESDSEEA